MRSITYYFYLEKEELPEEFKESIIVRIYMKGDRL